MGPQPPPIDPVTVAIAIATAVFGSATASWLGPYVVIFLGALLGSGWAASRRPPQPRLLDTVIHMLWLVLLALLFTVPAAELLSVYAKVEARWMLGPVAAVISGVGEDWPAVGRWAWRRFGGRIASRFSLPEPPAPKEGDEQ